MMKTLSIYLHSTNRLWIIHQWCKMDFKSQWIILFASCHSLISALLETFMKEFQFMCVGLKFEIIDEFHRFFTSKPVFIKLPWTYKLIDFSFFFVSVSFIVSCEILIRFSPVICSCRKKVRFQFFFLRPWPINKDKFFNIGGSIGIFFHLIKI